MSEEVTVTQKAGDQHHPQVVIYTTPSSRWRRFWFLILLLAFVFLLLILIEAVWKVYWPVKRSYGFPLPRVVIKEEGASAHAVLIQLKGLLYGGYIDPDEWSPVGYLHEILSRVRRTPKAAAVLLTIDSPGGEIMAVDQMFTDILDFQRSTGKPVVAFLDGIAASGGYYVAAACRKVISRPLTLTGSIGVLLHMYNYRGLMDKIGIQPQVYKSGRFKDILRADKLPEEVTPEERLLVQSIVDKYHSIFLTRIEEGRSYAKEKDPKGTRSLADGWKDYADGRVFLGSEAYDLGFVDQLGSFQDAFRAVKEMIGEAALELIEYPPTPQGGVLQKFLGRTKAFRLFPVDIVLQGPRLRPGAVYAVWPAAVDFGR